MALVPVSTRNRISPIGISTIEQGGLPYGSYEHIGPCNDPNCPICRGRHHKHHHSKRHHHHHHHHHNHHHHQKKYKSSFWDSFGRRGESASSIVSVHSVELNENRPYYNTQVTERSLVPINQTERQVATTTTRTRPFTNYDTTREAWVNNPSADDEIVCCRAYNGCRCPCWCCILFIVIIVILLIILIVLLATLL